MIEQGIKNGLLVKVATLAEAGWCYGIRRIDTGLVDWKEG